MMLTHSSARFCACVSSPSSINTSTNALSILARLNCSRAEPVFILAIVLNWLSTTLKTLRIPWREMPTRSFNCDEMRVTIPSVSSIAAPKNCSARSRCAFAAHHSQPANATSARAITKPIPVRCAMRRLAAASA